MANIKQQKKRILISERQRSRNLRYRSTMKTLTRGLIEAAEQGADDIAERARALEHLIDRAADVALKERRQLILVVRETPFSAIHLENMLSLTRAGAVIMPANPGFYFRPTSVGEIIDFMVARILDHLGVAHTLTARWGDEH